MTGIALTIVLISVSICVVRLVVAENTMTRIVAADAIGVMAIIALCLVSYLLNASYLLDIVLVYSVLLFIDVLVLAKYFEKGMLHK